MAYLLDTTAFSDLMRELPQMQTRLASLSPDETVTICTVVRGEILHGIARLPAGQRRDDLGMKATDLFAAVPCLPIAELVADDYAEIKLARQRKGLALDENDLWIAATARQSGATLISRDTDFQRIDGLKVEDSAGGIHE
jgi:predicted nucleic acid-binding protein